jgi:transposase
MESVMDEETASDLGWRVRAVERMQAGGNITGLARELKVSRWTLYRWREIYAKQGPAGLVMAPGQRFSLRKGKAGPLLGKAKAAYARLDELTQAQAQAALLERKVGQQALQIDFLTRAFKRVKESRPNDGASGETASTERSE